MNPCCKKALVIGGTSGIGLAVSKRLCDAGANVVAISRDPSRARGQLPDSVSVAACDSRKAEDLERLFSELAPFEILVNCATGGTRAAGPFMDMDIDGFKRSFDKLWGYANSVRSGLPHMPEDGCVVLVTGAPAKKSLPGQVALGTVGGAIQAFVLRLAREIKPRRINVVSPGLIDTPMLGPPSDARDKAMSKVVSNFLIPRLGEADEVAQAVEFLIRNDFVTGTTVDVDGGWILSE